jgi:diguanylate cyclase (GGDEF)-like protein/putative nucleotidyltransferase with HDIG domain
LVASPSNNNLTNKASETIRRGGREMKVLDTTKRLPKREKTESSQQLARPESRQKQREKFLGRAVGDNSILDRAARSLSRATNLDTLRKTALDAILEASNLESCVLYLLDEDTNELVLSSCTGGTNKSGQALGGILLRERIPAKAIKTNVNTSQDVLRDLFAVANQGRLLEPEDIGTLISIPLKSRNRIVGTIVAGARSRRQFSIKDIRLLQTLGCQIGVVIDNAQLLEKMWQLSMVDEPTGLYNRCYLEEALEIEIHRSQRCGCHFSLAMMDLDGFKEYNDQFGHPSGDILLQDLACVLKSVLRKTDIAYRYGGDEFSIVFPAADGQRTMTLVDRIRSAFFEMLGTHSGNIQTPIGISAGIAQFPQAAVTTQSLIYLADSALYYAKKRGRNKSVQVSNLMILGTSQTSREAQQQLYSLINLIEAKEPYTVGHARNVSIICDILGNAIGLSAEELLELRTAALFHDIGKTRVPGSILSKPAKLTREELQIMKDHSLEGARLVGRVAEFRRLVPIIKHHHERYDGTGYPSRLSGDQIPLHSRIISIADAYDTLIHHRSYSEAMSTIYALNEICKCSGTQFDPKLVGALVDISDSLN